MRLESEHRVSSPKKAVFKVVQSLHDNSDARAALIITVHKTDVGGAANIWERHGTTTFRVIPEREFSFKPKPDVLLEEILRLIQLTSESPVGTGEYSRPKEGVLGLFHQAKEIAANSHHG